MAIGKFHRDQLGILQPGISPCGYILDGRSPPTCGPGSSSSRKIGHSLITPYMQPNIGFLGFPGVDDRPRCKSVVNFEYLLK